MRTKIIIPLFILLFAGIGQSTFAQRPGRGGGGGGGGRGYSGAVRSPGYSGGAHVNFGGGGYRGSYGGSRGYVGGAYSHGGYYGGYRGGYGGYRGGYYGGYRNYWGYGFGLGLGFGYPGYYGYGYPYGYPYGGYGGYPPVVVQNQYYDYDEPADPYGDGTVTTPQRRNQRNYDDDYNDNSRNDNNSPNYNNNNSNRNNNPNYNENSNGNNYPGPDTLANRPGTNDNYTPSSSSRSTDKVWVKAHWKNTNSGWVWIDGYWKNK